MSYNELIALIDACVNRNGVHAITGRIMNGVLKAMVNQLGAGFVLGGVAHPADDPGTPEAPVCYFASEEGTYTHFGGLTIAAGEFALFCYDLTDGWYKETIYEGITEINASIDDQVGTPEVYVEYQNGVLSFDFRNMKGETGVPAGFGNISADVDANIGTPSVTVSSSGPDTAKVLAFHFKNLKGETGVTSVVATVDNTSGNPTCAVSLNGQELHLDFTGLKGAQGDTGVSANYPIAIVNNLTTNDPTSALSAAMGVQLESEVSQLEHKVGDLEDGETVLQQQINAIVPVVIEGNVTNAPDNEDITATPDNRLKFKDRPATLNNKGYKILRADKTFAEQVTDINTIYEIRYGFVLELDEEVTIPSGCELRFNGGRISNGTIVGNHTIISSVNDSIFSSVLFSGTFDTPFNAEWLLPAYDANADYTTALTELFNCGATRIVFTAAYRYKVTDTIVINNDVEISSSVKFTGERNGVYPNIYCESNKTVVHYKHTDSHKKVRIGGIAVYSGDKTNPDYSTPIVKVEYLAGGWAGAKIDFHILDNYESESYDGSSYEKHGMVGIEVDVVSGSFTLSEIGGSISCYKALYIHRSGTGFITDVNISSRIEAAYGGEVEGNKYYLRGEFQTFTFPNDIPAIRPSECFFYGGEGYSEDSFIWDLNSKKGDNNLLSSVKYGTDGSVFSQVTTIPGRSLPNLPTAQSVALLASSNGEFNNVPQLALLTIECSQDDFSTTPISENDVVNINGLFGGKRMESSEISSSSKELELYGAFLNPNRVSSVGINTSNPLQVRTTARYRMASAHWVRFFTYRSGSFLVTIRKYSDSGYTNLVEEYTRRPEAMMEGNSQTMRESFCFVETSDYYYTEIVYVYNTMISDVQVYGQNTYQLIGFNVFNFKTSGDTKQFVSSPIIENDWQISRESAKNIYVPLNGSRCNQGFHIVAPTTLSVNLEVDFEVTPVDSNFPDYGGVSATRGRLIVRTNGTVQITGVRDTTVGFYKSDHEISGLSYYRLLLANCWVKVLRITARHILLKLGTNGSTSVGTNQATISNTKYRVIGTSSERPTLVANDVGYMYFDKTLGNPIWWNGTGWVDATGTAVN